MNSSPTRAEQNTRSQLLEVAGQVFAEKGFDRATGKEICERAGANAAAINYYFQGMEGLYSAVLAEAHNRLVSLDALSATVASTSDGKAKLHALVEMFVHSITNPESSAWILRVLTREIISPSPFLDELRDKHLLPKLGMIKKIASELMKLPEDHPAVSRGAVCVIAPFNLLLIADRKTLKTLFPGLSLNKDDADVLVRHLVNYALGGLAAIAKEEKTKI